MDNRNFALRIDLPPLPVSTPARPLPPGAALPDLGALRAAPPPARPAGVSFGGQLVDALLRSLSGSATPPGSLQLQLQWQSPATAYAPPLPTPLTPALPTPAAPQPPGAGTAPPTHPAPLPTAPASTPSPRPFTPGLATAAPPLPLPGAAALLPPLAPLMPSAPTAPRAASGETLNLQAQLPLVTADGRRLTASLNLALLPTLRRDYPDIAAQLETALAAGALPALRTDSAAEALAGQLLQFQWTDPRALWPLQSLAMRGLLRFPSLAEERDRERQRRRALHEAARQAEPETPLRPLPPPADDGGPPRIAPEVWLWHSVKTFLRWLRQQLGG